MWKVYTGEASLSLASSGVLIVAVAVVSGTVEQAPSCFGLCFWVPAGTASEVVAGKCVLVAYLEP